MKKYSFWLQWANGADDAHEPGGAGGRRLHGDHEGWTGGAEQSVNFSQERLLMMCFYDGHYNSESDVLSYM